uniref:Secreted protein n=1 Tax=Anguilla anguilla TaxID=7936 RepID=A0A0E9UAF3_ANGAN
MSAWWVLLVCGVRLGDVCLVDSAGVRCAFGHVCLVPLPSPHKAVWKAFLGAKLTCDPCVFV